MRTVVLGPPTAEFDALLTRRRALGHDRYDEVWQGEYHMAPAPNQRHGQTAMSFAFAVQRQAARAGLVFSTEFNLGEPDDYRVPDVGLHRDWGDALWVPTAALVVEVVSPHDESWLKFDHYAAHGVDEVVIADPAQRTLDWFVLEGDGYRPVEHSPLLDVDVAEVATSLGWGEGDVLESGA